MRRVAWGALLVGLLAAPAAWGRQRVAVVVASDDAAIAAEQDLLDDLGDVAIAALADIPDAELVGTRELRRPLAESVGERGWAACLADAACLLRVGDVADAPRAVIALVQRRDGGFVLELTLADTRAAVVDARVSLTLSPDVGALIAGVQRGVADLLAQRPRLQLPPRSSPPAVASESVLLVPPTAGGGRAHQAPSLLEARANGDAAATDRPRDSNVPLPISMLAYGAAGLAVVSFSGGFVTGALAEEAPSGSTRGQKQADLDRRAGLAEDANGLLITGAILSAVSVAAFLWERHWTP